MIVPARASRAAHIGTAALIATALVALALPASGAAATFVVDTTDDASDATPGDGDCDDGSGNCSLRAAIEEANVLGGQDQVNLPPGTYAIDTAGGFGQFEVSSDIVIEGTGTEDETIINRGPPNPTRVFNVTAAGALDLRDATVRGGVIAAGGGGIRTGGVLTLRRVVVADNVAQDADGGGIATSSSAGDTTIVDSTIGSPDGVIPGNRAGGGGVIVANGGGIHHAVGAATLTILRSQVSDNRVDSTSVTSGAGIYSDADVEIEDSTIDGNLSIVTGAGTAGSGALNNNAGALTIRSSSITANEVEGSGGAAASTAGISNSSTEPGLIVDSTIADNHSTPTGAGPAALTHTGSTTGPPTLTVRRSTITGNDEAGITAFKDLVLENSTVSENGVTAGPHDGLQAGFGAQVTVRSSTIAAHGSGSGAIAFGDDGAGTNSMIAIIGSILDANIPNCTALAPATIVSGGGNVDDGNSCELAAGGDQPNTDPLLGPLQSNGGPTETHAIPNSSPARDAVPGGACPPPATDQRGVSRPQGAACDGGAFEIAVAPPPGGGGSGGGGGGTEPVAPPDLTLHAKAKQTAKKLKVEVGCGQVACSVDLAGKAKVPRRSAEVVAAAKKKKKFKLKPKSVDLAAGATETVRLKFRNNKKAVKKVKRLLGKGGRKARKRAKAVVKATATGAGGADTAKQKVKLKR